jgi:hypothetical protein
LNEDGASVPGSQSSEVHASPDTVLARRVVRHPRENGAATQGHPQQIDAHSGDAGGSGPAPIVATQDGDQTMRIDEESGAAPGSQDTALAARAHDQLNTATRQHRQCQCLMLGLGSRRRG